MNDLTDCQILFSVHVHVQIVNAYYIRKSFFNKFELFTHRRPPPLPTRAIIIARRRHGRGKKAATAIWPGQNIYIPCCCNNNRTYCARIPIYIYILYTHQPRPRVICYKNIHTLTFTHTHIHTRTLFTLLYSISSFANDFHNTRQNVSHVKKINK